MKSFLRNTLAISSLLAAGALGSTAAHAQCGVNVPKFEMQKQSWQSNGAHMMYAGWRHRDDDIVGYWNIVVTAKGNTGTGAPPDGTILDAGLQQWHDDGTEFLNSSNQHPITQNYCLGVWEKTGPFTYKLNHFAYNYNLDQSIAGLVRIREVVTLSHDGNRMTGFQTVDVYDKVRNLLAHLQGTVVGKRIDTDTTANDIQ